MDSNQRENNASSPSSSHHIGHRNGNSSCSNNPYETDEGVAATAGVVHTNGALITTRSHASNPNFPPHHPYRVSPYIVQDETNLNMDETLSIGDDQTIDAAVVEEIRDDNYIDNNINTTTIRGPIICHDGNPSLSSPLHHRSDDDNNNHYSRNIPTATTNNFRAEAHVIAMHQHPVASDQLPAVEPEVDIEEIHIDPDRNAMSTISGLTNTNSSIIDQHDSKHPPPSPPMIPTSLTPHVAAAAVIPNDYRNTADDNIRVQDHRRQSQQSLPYPPIHSTFATATVAAATATTTTPPHRVPLTEYRGYSTGTTTSTSLPPPSVPVFKSMMMNNRSTQQQQHSSGSDFTPNNTSSNESQQQQHELLEYKDQARPVSVPNRGPMSSRNTSSNSGGSDNTPNNNIINNNTQNDSAGGARSDRYNNTSSGTNSRSDDDVGNHNTRNDNVDDEHIPVVAAILVPAERLAAEERFEEQWLQQQQQQQQQQFGYQSTAPPDQPETNTQQQQRSNSDLSSGESTLTTSHMSSNNNTNSNSNNHPNDSHLTAQSNEGNTTQRTKSSENINNSNTHAPMSERRFWMTIILTALVLNSVLVAGAVVGGFCAAGKCTTREGVSNSSNNEPDVIRLQPNVTIAPTNVPSSSPSKDRILSQVPTMANTGATIELLPPTTDIVPTVSPNPAFDLIGETLIPTIINPETGGGLPVTLLPTILDSVFPGNSAYTNGTAESAPQPVDDDMVPDSTPAPTNNFISDIDPNQGRRGTAIPTISPTMINTPSVYNTTKTTPTDVSDDNSTTNPRDESIRFVVIIPIIAGIEMMIILGLVWYYRRWKLRRGKQLSYTTDDNHTTPSLPAVTNATPTEQQGQESLSSVGNTSTTGSRSSSNDSRESRMTTNNPLPTIEECIRLEV